MWSEGDIGELNAVNRANTASEVCVVDDRMMAVASDAMPNIAQLNVTQKSSLHLGPRFVSVTQNVHNAEMVKNVPLPCYLWNIIKSTSRGERLWCAASVSVLLIFIALIAYFSTRAKDEPFIDVAPHEWNITRAMWLAQPFLTAETTTAFEPLRLVIIQHTVSQPCDRFKYCAAELRQIQAWQIRDNGYDISYNFLIGNDGRVYEGRGWRKEGAHTQFYNRCSLGIAFIGDYREEEPGHSTVTDLQINRTMKLLEYGVEAGYLHPSYHVMGAKDLKPTASPGSNLYHAIQKWNHYNNGKIYRNRTCEQIYADFEDSVYT